MRQELSDFFARIEALSYDAASGGELLRLRLADPKDLFSRHAFEGHVTVSACLLSPDELEVLSIYSSKFHKNLLPGGHVDEGESPFEAALRELCEECGVSRKDIEAFCNQPIGLSIHWIERNDLRQEPRHIHFDAQYVFRIHSRDTQFCIDQREVASIQWIPKSGISDSYPQLFDALAMEAWQWTTAS